MKDIEVFCCGDILAGISNLPVNQNIVPSVYPVGEETLNPGAKKVGAMSKLTTPDLQTVIAVDYKPLGTYTASTGGGLIGRD